MKVGLEYFNSGMLYLHLHIMIGLATTPILPGSGTYGTGNNFSHDWTDNFDSWDTTRWDKATHTFNGNNCDFIQENAVFEDGKLILCLTNNTNIGYVDLQPPTLVWARASTDNNVLVTFSEELDQATAENTSNYIIQGVTVNSATLQQDLKSVELSVSGLSNSFYQVILL